ncbi:MAG: FAD-binding oxidoreductase [Gemmatimonadaceae bacterium]
MESARIIPTAPPRDDDAISPDVWGFRDTAFAILPNGNVTLTGARYGLSGLELPDLLPWMRQTLGVEISASDTHDAAFPPAIPTAVANEGFMAEVRGLLAPGAISDDPLARLRHGHGHTLEAMYAIKYGCVARVPDVIVQPSAVEHVSALVEAARRHDVCLVPYGGGTNVTDALRCPAGEQRMIVSVDLGRMNRILWIDPVNRMACIQAGAVGRHIQAQLAEHGFTLGHEPDSVEFSTLGGWIATHASGMKKNKYGNIEDIVLDVHAITARGELARPSVAPRESVGIDARRWLFGSEGTLGIITDAVVKIFPRPEVERYDAVLFPDFDTGVAFLRDLTRESTPPASVRLVDNLQFQLSQMLKPKATGFKASIRRAEKVFVTKVKGFDTSEMVACTLVYEGTRAQVAREEAEVARLVKRHGGMRAGSENGRKGYELTFGIAYFRDFIMKHWILGESFETSVSWSEAVALCANVKRRMRDEYAARKLPGIPFVTCRVTQLYQTGVAVYFYFGFYHKGVANPDQVYAELEHAARDEILKSGGSLSHHHGIGKIRREYLPRVFSPATLDWAASVKHAVDPMNTFGIANQ